MSHYLWMAGRSTEARAFAQSAQVIADPLSDFPLRVGANFYVGTVCLTSGDYRQAEHYLRTVVKLVGGERHRDRCGLAAFPAAMARGYLTWALTELGTFGDGVVLGEEGVRIAEALDHPYSLIVASWGLAHLHRVRGELDPAVRLLERALALCHDWNLPVLTSITAGFLGYAYALSGRLTEGLPLLDAGHKAFESVQTLIVAQTGEAYLLAGELDHAVTSAGRAVRLARERDQRGYEAWALLLLGDIAAQPASLNSGVSESHYRQALALADDLGMRPLLSRCHLALGTLYRRTGRRQEAEPQLAMAAAMCREMDMRFWLAQAETQMREL